jgi:hypothetical protein
VNEYKCLTAAIALPIIEIPSKTRYREKAGATETDESVDGSRSGRALESNSRVTLNERAA